VIGIATVRAGPLTSSHLGVDVGSGVRSVNVLERLPERLTIRAILDDPAGDPRERVVLMEDGQLVEGPPLDEKNPAPAVL